MKFCYHYLKFFKIKQTQLTSSVFFFHAMEVKSYQHFYQQFGYQHSLKYILCLTEKICTGLEVNDDKIFILG